MGRGGRERGAGWLFVHKKFRTRRPRSPARRRRSVEGGGAGNSPTPETPEWPHSRAPSSAAHSKRTPGGAAASRGLSRSLLSLPLCFLRSLCPIHRHPRKKRLRNFPSPRLLLVFGEAAGRTGEGKGGEIPSGVQKRPQQKSPLRLMARPELASVGSPHYPSCGGAASLPPPLASLPLSLKCPFPVRKRDPA